MALGSLLLHSSLFFCFFVFQVVTNRDTQETLLCMACVFEVSNSEHGAQHHIYRLVKEWTPPPHLHTLSIFPETYNLKASGSASSWKLYLSSSLDGWSEFCSVQVFMWLQLWIAVQLFYGSISFSNMLTSEVFFFFFFKEPTRISE